MSPPGRLPPVSQDPLNGGCTISSSVSHLDDCCLLFSGRLDESLERRQSTLSGRGAVQEPDIQPRSPRDVRLL